MVATSTSVSHQRKTLPFKSLQNYSSFRPPSTSMSNKLPTPTPWRAASRGKKYVTFAPFLEVRDLFRTGQDLENSWYGASEYAKFDRERRHTVAALHHVGGNLHFLDPAVYTLHGLERHLDRQSSYQRKMVARLHCFNVLNQQAKHGCNEERLRRVSEYFSKEMSQQVVDARGSVASTLDSWYY